jgi:hypothetical protein
MDQSLSTVSQTPKFRNKQHLYSLFKPKFSIRSPKLQKTIERINVQNEYKLTYNRLNKLKKIDEMINKDIKVAIEKSMYLSSLQYQNNLKAKEKMLYQERKQKVIEDKRLSFSSMRTQRKQKKSDSFNANFIKKKSKAELIKSLKQK